MILTKKETDRKNALLAELESFLGDTRQHSTGAVDAFETIADMDPVEIRNIVLFGIAELDARNQGGELDCIDRELRKRLGD